MGMGIWNVDDGDRVNVHFTHSKQEPPPDKWSVRVGEIGLYMSTAQFDALLREMLDKRRAHETEMNAGDHHP